MVSGLADTNGTAFLGPALPIPRARPNKPPVATPPAVPQRARRPALLRATVRDPRALCSMPRIGCRGARPPNFMVMGLNVQHGRRRRGRDARGQRQHLWAAGRLSHPRAGMH